MTKIPASTKPDSPWLRRATLLTSVAVLALAPMILGGVFFLDAKQPNSANAAQAVAMSHQPAGFGDIVATVKPAVISVRVRIDEPIPAGIDHSRIPPGSPLDKFLRDYGIPDRSRAHEIIIGEGSGFFISPDGYAVTNYHVVDNAQSVMVTTIDGKTYEAKVIGTDPMTDLALIKVHGQHFPFIKFADHAPRDGDWVIAIGNPYGLGGTVTAGIVSAERHDIGAGPYTDYIQIDAPINRGNSGGPAFNTNGKVIGVNTAIFSPSGGSVGIGFDIPAATVKNVVAQLKENGHVTRGWLGAEEQSVTPEIAAALGMKKAEGAMVTGTLPSSPAAKAGLRSGDVITAVDGTATANPRELARLIGAKAPGTVVKLSVLQDNAQKNLTATLGTMPTRRQQQAKAETGSGVAPAEEHGLGLALVPAKDVRNAGAKGVVVVAIDPSGLAAENGVQAGDVILDVGSKPVSSPGDIQKSLESLRKEGKLAALMRIKSGGMTRFVAVPLHRA